VRAYEVYVLTGKTITWHDEQSRLVPPRYTAVKIALDFSHREDLYERIDRRASAMFQDGLVEETQRLLDKGVPATATSMQAIGYKETAAYLRGECSREEAMELVCRKSRQYAKRQLTWFRRDKDIHWIFWEKQPDLAYARRVSTEIFSPCAVK
jgi:tRNA dimethylallyltransferase